MGRHILGSLTCLIVALMLANVLAQDGEGMPTWVLGLGITGVVVLLVSAWRVFRSGLQRKYVAEGPRSRIVIDAARQSSRDTRSGNRS